jgi:predicted metal-dependent hydrolase
LKYTTKYSVKRKTLGLVVERDKSVVVLAPSGTSREILDDFIERMKFLLVQQKFTKPKIIPPIKVLEKQNLRDHMTTLELLFSALGEEITQQIAITDNTQGFMENQDAAIQGGRFAGNAIERLEKE